MKFWKSNKTQRNTEELLKEVNNSKPEELENLLQKIEEEIKKSEDKNAYLLTVKTIITSSLASIKK
jgi:nanoRNase/pAp phosphatase (c-di-AMP/oligoRNAs hydrolase)